MTLADTFFKLEFLHNIQKYSGSVVGIKLSGKCLDDLEMRRNIVRQVIELKTLGTRIAVVHGGGKQITEEAKAAGIEKREIAGLRYTTDPELEIADRCVRGLTRDLVRDFHEVSAKMGLKISAMGMSGYDAKLITADLYDERFTGSRTGKVVKVDEETLRFNMDKHILVLNSICAGDDGGNWNVNADDVIEAVAKASGAKLAIMCSDTPLYDKNKVTITSLFTDQIAGYIADGTFNDVLAPKVRAIGEIANNVCPVAIVNGGDRTAIERELYTTEGGGTRVEARPSQAPAGP